GRARVAFLRLDRTRGVVWLFSKMFRRRAPHLIAPSGAASNGWGARAARRRLDLQPCFSAGPLVARIARAGKLSSDTRMDPGRFRETGSGGGTFAFPPGGGGRSMFRRRRAI